MKKEFAIVVEERGGRYHVTEADTGFDGVQNVVGFNRARQEDLADTVRAVLPDRTALRITNKIPQ